MGTWEVGIYQNDLSADVKDDYIGKLKAGKSDEEALREILEFYKEEAEDEDCKYDFYLALADTLWDTGRLTDEIKTIALTMIEEDRISERWQSEQIRKERGKVLDKLKEKLHSEMSERKKISVHKPYILGWEEGDVYTFQIKESVKGYEEYMGGYALFYVDRIYLEDWNVKGVKDELADVYFFLMPNRPTHAEDIHNATNICFYKDDSGNRYRVHICESSKRGRPKDLNYLGKCISFKYPANDKIRSGHFSWSKYVYERDILRGYQRQIEYEMELH